MTQACQGLFSAPQLLHLHPSCNCKLSSSTLTVIPGGGDCATRTSVWLPLGAGLDSLLCAALPSGWLYLLNIIYTILLTLCARKTRKLNFCLSKSPSRAPYTEKDATSRERQLPMSTLGNTQFVIQSCEFQCILYVSPFLCLQVSPHPARRRRLAVSSISRKCRGQSIKPKAESRRKDVLGPRPFAPPVPFSCVSLTRQARRLWRWKWRRKSPTFHPPWR